MKGLDLKRLMRQIVLVVAGVLALFGVGTANAVTHADASLGQWYTTDQEAKVEITKTHGKYYGKIVWLKEPLYPEEDEEAGQPKRDRNNPDEVRRSERILGLTVLKNFVFDGSSAWKKGTVYDPDNGKTYKCTIWLGEEDSLMVRGYIGFSLIGRTEVWTRVPKDEKAASTAVTNPNTHSPDRKPDIESVPDQPVDPGDARTRPSPMLN